MPDVDLAPVKGRVHNNQHGPDALVVPAMDDEFRS
jgi:hypothetical protein